MVATDLTTLWENWPQLGFETENAGPSLVAGDWLAWQCAYAGGYFEMQPNAIAAMIESN